MEHRGVVRVARCGAVAAMVGTAALSMTSARASTETGTPPRVTGASYTFDVLRSGSNAAPSIAYSAAISVVGAAVPSAGQMAVLDPVVAPAVPAITEQLGPLVEDLSASGQDAADAGDGLVAPAAPVNPVANAVIGGTANGLDGVAALSNGALQPLDRTIAQVADLARLTMAPADTTR